MVDSSSLLLRGRWCLFRAGNHQRPIAFRSTSDKESAMPGTRHTWYCALHNSVSHGQCLLGHPWQQHRLDCDWWRHSQLIMDPMVERESLSNRPVWGNQMMLHISVIERNSRFPIISTLWTSHDREMTQYCNCSHSSPCVDICRCMVTIHARKASHRDTKKMWQVIKCVNAGWHYRHVLVTYF